MYSLYKVIEALCDSRGITVQTMSKDIGLHRNVMPRLRSDPDKELSVKTIKKIATYFNVPTDYLLDPGDPNPRDIPPESELSDDQLIFAFWKNNPKNMDKDDLERLRSFAKYLEQEKGE